MTSYSYSTDYTKSNRLSLLAGTIPVKFTNSSYFRNIMDLHSRANNLCSKYKVLLESIMEDKSQADKFELIVNTSGMGELDKKLKESGHGFLSISYASNLKYIHLSSRKINPALQDYINKYAELLETLKYILADIYRDYLGDRDTFNRFISRDTTRCKNEFNFDYFTGFNKYLWNEQKHNTDITVTQFTRGEERKDPHLRIYSGIFNRMSIEEFAMDSLDKMVELIEFLNIKTNPIKV